jgi:hypothetical protein
MMARPLRYRESVLGTSDPEAGKTNKRCEAAEETVMRRFILSVAAVVLSVALAATAQAGPKGNGGGSHSSSSYHMTHGTKFKGGYFYKGKEHSHWTHRYWYGRYGCYTYYCPSTCGWYYYYPKQECYYPVSYITTATPVAQPAPVGVETGVKQIVNVTNNSPGAATAGSGAAGSALPPAPPATPMPPSPPGQ